MEKKRETERLQERILKEILQYGSDIIASEGMAREKDLIQHGGVSCYEHSLMVAWLSLWLARRLGISVDTRSMVRGALLHDYFLYDWHERDASHRLHGFFHAKKALDNAGRDFALNGLEMEIIERHMFPLNISKMPQHRESAIVNLMDKASAVGEMVAYERIAAVLEELAEMQRALAAMQEDQAGLWEAGAEEHDDGRCQMASRRKGRGKE